MGRERKEKSTLEVILQPRTVCIICNSSLLRTRVIRLPARKFVSVLARTSFLAGKEEGEVVAVFCSNAFRVGEVSVVDGAGEGAVRGATGAGVREEEEGLPLLTTVDLGGKSVARRSGMDADMLLFLTIREGMRVNA